MSATTITRPSEAEVLAAEQVIAESNHDAPDGYWRTIAEAALTAASAAGPSPLIQRTLDSLYMIMMMDAGRASELAAEAYHELSGLTREAARTPHDAGLTDEHGAYTAKAFEIIDGARFDRALGEGRR